MTKAKNTDNETITVTISTLLAEFLVSSTSPQDFIEYCANNYEDRTVLVKKYLMTDLSNIERIKTQAGYL